MPILEHDLVDALEHGQLHRVGALIGQQEPQACERTVLPKDAQRPHLLMREGQPLRAERLPRALEGEPLTQGARRLVVVPRCLADHLQDGALARGDGRGPLPDEDALRPDPFGGQVIGTSRAPLHLDGDDPLVIDRADLAGHEERHVRTDSVPGGVGRPQHHVVRVQSAHHRAVVGHADQERPSVPIGEGDDRLLDILRMLPLIFEYRALRLHRAHLAKADEDVAPIIPVLIKDVKHDEKNVIRIDQDRDEGEPRRGVGHRMCCHRA